MPRPKSPFKKKRLSVYFHEKLYQELVELLEDPLNPGEIPYGELSKHMNQLVVKDLREKNLLGEEALRKIEKVLETGGV